MASPAPDGGWGWAVVAGSFLAHFIILGTQYSGGIFLVAFLREWPDADASSAAWVSAAPVAMMLLASQVAGPLTARWGPRIVCFVGAVLGSGGLLLTASSQALWQAAVAMGVVAGVGMSFGFVPSILVVPHWFSMRRALALGIAVAGSGVGTFTVAPVLDAGIAALGWRSAMRWLALTMAVSLTVAGSLYAMPAKPAAEEEPDARLSSRAGLRGGSAGLTKPDPAGRNGAAAASQARGEKEAAARDSGAADPATEAGPAGGLLAAAEVGTGSDKEAATGTGTGDHARAPPASSTMLAVLMRPRFWQMVTACVVATGGYNAVFAHLVNSAVQAGVSPADAALTVSVLGAFSTVGRVVAGRVSDARWLAPTTMWYGSLLIGGAVTLLVPVLETSVGGRVVYGAVFGLCAGNFIALMPVATADVLGLETLPTGMAIMYSGQTLPVLAGPPAAGAIAVAAGSYWPAWIFIGGLMTAGGAFFLLDRQPRAGPQRAGDKSAGGETAAGKARLQDEATGELEMVEQVAARV